MDQSKYLNLIAQHLSNSLSAEEQKELSIWVEADPSNKALMEEVSSLWKLTNEDDGSFEVNPEAAWDKIEPKLALAETDATEEVKTIKLSPWSNLLKIAAAALILLAAAWWVFQPTTPINEEWIAVNSLSEQGKVVLLPDGSKITLNENTTVKYMASFSPRQVLLEGEGFFEVEKDPANPFEVLGQKSKTVVLGTSFNVRAYPQEEEVEVTVVTGKVAFQAQEKIEEVEILLPGDAAFFKKEALLVERNSTKPENATSWKTKTLNFNSTPMKEVVKNLERHFNIEIQIRNNDILNCHFSGDFNQPNLKETIEVISYAIGGNFELENGKYTLFGPGCK